MWRTVTSLSGVQLHCVFSAKSDRHRLPGTLLTLDSDELAEIALKSLIPVHERSAGMSKEGSVTEDSSACFSMSSCPTIIAARMDKMACQANTKGSGANSFSFFPPRYIRRRFGQPLQETLPFGSSECLTHVRAAPHFPPRRQPSARRHGPFPRRRHLSAGRRQATPPDPSLPTTAVSSRHHMEVGARILNPQAPRHSHRLAPARLDKPFLHTDPSRPFPWQGEVFHVRLTITRRCPTLRTPRSRAARSRLQTCAPPTDPSLSSRPALGSASARQTIGPCSPKARLPAPASRRHPR